MKFNSYPLHGNSQLCASVVVGVAVIRAPNSLTAVVNLKCFVSMLANSCVLSPDLVLLSRCTGLKGVAQGGNKEFTPDIELVLQRNIFPLVGPAVGVAAGTANGVWNAGLEIVCEAFPTNGIVLFSDSLRPASADSSFKLIRSADQFSNVHSSE